ncbi:MAG: lytic transglycosylase domain-containing protein [Bacteroidales bacterium]|nr:lytic transglycosylase domain-containing protein [Bacteroidales bacterium]
MKNKLYIFISALFVSAAVLFVCSTEPQKAEADSARVAQSSIMVPQVPAEVNFCGENVPLSNTDVYECLDREIIVNSFLHSSTLLNLKRSGRFFPIIEPILAENGIPDDMKYLCVAESNLNPLAKSPAGALGPWQFLEVTAREFGLRVDDDVDERADVVKSTQAACRMLKAHYRVLGSWTLVAAAYNGGLARVKRVAEQQKQRSYYNMHWAEETKRYVFRILALKLIMTHPDAYGFIISDADLYAPYETKDVEVLQPISDLPSWAVEHGTTYRAVKLLNPWLMRNKVDRVGTNGIVIRIPAED